MSTTVKTTIHRVNLREGSIKIIEDAVAVETPIRIIVNGRRATTLFSLPRQIKELGVGWLLSQAIITSIDEIVCVQSRKNSLRITCNTDVGTRLKVAGITEPVDSSCGSTSEDFAFLADRLKKPFVNSDYMVQAEDLLRFVRVLNERAVLFRLTGGTHSAAIFCEGKLVAFAEDVGRHNAVDKVIGAAAMTRVDFSKCLLVSSGRQPANMVLKAARIGIPIIASVAAPLSSGIEAARNTGVTLVCFVRGQRLNVYTHPERIWMANTCLTA